jgi:glycerophosphoryl diester phosphodiesterase
MNCIAHRGWSSKAPENTVAAFRLALQEPQMYAVELDVHLSKDGIPVVIHDHSLERTTNGSGLVKESTFKQLHTLDAGSWFGSTFSSEKIPSLEEVFELFKPTTCRIVIELKQTGNYYQELEEAVVDLIKKYNMHSQVVVASFDHESVVKVKRLDSNIETGLIIFGRPTLLLEQLIHTGASFISMHYAFITEELVQLLLENEIRVGAWTVDDAKVIERLSRYSDHIQITTNDPEQFLKVTLPSS